MQLAAVVVLSLVSAEPRVLDPAYELTLVAAEPDIVTPVGLAFDDRGRLLVIESHTHFRPDDYDGPPADRLRLVELGEDGRATGFRTYYEGSVATMGLRPGPDGWIYAATRMEVFRLKDADGDGVAEIREDIVRLETDGDYPHNGLSGLAFGPDHKLNFGMGENLGRPYEIVGKLYVGMGQNRGHAYEFEGRDGQRLAGGGEGGNVFRCDPDGSNLERVATGFWNPFGLCFDPHGRLFAVDNDPDGQPPCRLLHVVPGGDYGYQFRYGRSGRHPLQAWDGELPGTLPMAAGTGEAPCGVVSYEGGLWVGSWGHHRIERYALESRGATVVGIPQIVVQGDEHFRPVDLAIAPDGSLYFTDWVDKSYTLHSKGRLWRLKRKSDAPPATAEFPPLSAEEQRADQARQRLDLAALASDDPYLRQAAIWGLIADEEAFLQLKRHLSGEGRRDGSVHSSRWRLGLLQAERWRDRLSEHERHQRLAASLRDPDPNVCLYAVRWIADERIEKLRDAVQSVLDRNDLTPRLFRAVVAAVAWLDDDDRTGNDYEGLAEILDDGSRPASIRAMALRLLPANHKSLTTERLAQLVASTEEELRREAIRTLAAGEAKPDRLDLLDRLFDRDANEAKFSEGMIADAIVGLANDVERHRNRLEVLANHDDGVIAAGARRVLSPHAAEESPKPPPEDLDAWQKLVEGSGDRDAGWRVFFRSGGVACARCHTLDGRGNAVGPDLTDIGRRMDRERLLESILLPSKEVAPQYVPWTLVLTDGRVLTGLPFEVRNAAPGIEHFVAPDGERFTLKTTEIETRQAASVSIMPSGLEKLMTVEELRDLLAALGSEKRSPHSN